MRVLTLKSLFLFQIKPAISKMQAWDEMLLSRLSQGRDNKQSFVYSVSNDLDAIALSKDGNGFAIVELSMNSKLVLSGILRARFLPGSSRMYSVQWSTVKDECGSNSELAPGKHSGHSSRSEPLHTQSVHPSVVSLDVDKNTDTDGGRARPRRCNAAHC